MAKRYSISFDTNEAPGRIRAVWVELGHWWMKPKEVASVDLVSHPLYPKLEQYVHNNPSAEQLALPIVDQRGQKVGVHYVSRQEHQQVPAFVDEHGTTWLPPTPWAYRQVCQARDQWQARAEELKEALRPFAERCDDVLVTDGDDDWVEFRMLAGEYRRALAAYRDVSTGEPT